MNKKNNFKLFINKEEQVKSHFSLNGLEFLQNNNENNPNNIINERINEPLEDESDFLEKSIVKPFGYQIEAIRWMNSIEKEYLLNINVNDKKLLPVGGILADVMGLGKTIDSLLLILYDFYKYKKIENLGNDLLSFENVQFLKRFTFKPTLIIASLTLVYNWYDEATVKFNIPQQFILKYHGENRKKKLMQMLSEGKVPLVILTTYHTLQREYKDVFETNNEVVINKEDESEDDEKEEEEEEIKEEEIITTLLPPEEVKITPINQYSPLYEKVEFKRIFYDEAHVARNKKKNTFALKNLNTEARFGLTGTPIFNSPDDIINLSHVCTEREPLEKFTNSINIENWKKKYLLRRNKDIINIPELNHEDVWLELYPEEKLQYEKLEQIAQKTYEAVMVSNNTNQYKQILKVLVRLRQECAHPYLKLGFGVTSKILHQVKNFGCVGSYNITVSPSSSSLLLINIEKQQQRLLEEENNKKQFSSYTQDEIEGLINMNPNIEENGNLNFVLSDEEMKERKKILNKMKKTKYKKNKMNIQNQLTNLLQNENNDAAEKKLSSESENNKKRKSTEITLPTSNERKKKRLNDSIFKNLEKKEKKEKIEKFLSVVSFTSFNNNDSNHSTNHDSNNNGKNLIKKKIV